MKFPAALSPLAERNFRLLWIGQGVSSIGDSLVIIALAFATLSVAHSASALGLVLALSTVARVVALPIGGVWSDRLPRQLVMLTSDGVRAAVQVIVGALLITGRAQLWHLVIGAIVYSLADGFFMPASGALVPQTVSAERLQQANALMGLSRSVTQVGGPAVAGVLVAVFGPGWVFVIDAGTFAVSAISLSLLRVPPITGKAQASFWTELADGLRAVTSRRWYLLNLGAHALWNFAIAAFFVLGPIVAKNKLGGPSAWGLIGASMGVGAILGGLTALRVMPRRPLVVANLALILTAPQLLALAVPLPTAAIMGFCVVGWAGLTFLNEVWFATVPQLIPAAVLARANSIDWLLSIIAMPIGFAVSGPVADRIGIPTTLVAAAVIMAVPCFLVVLIPGVRHVKRTAEGRIVLEGAS
ncbi:MAG TPA: MFS transporter [Candidatus Dormibacteraeota bacterium]|nr:MFS transporter [Candidatus Dormibacteraeota bacterium]